MLVASAVGGRAVGQPALFLADLGQTEPASAKLGRHGQLQVAGEPQLLEVLGEEAVLAVVGRRALAEGLQQFIAEDALP